MTPTQKKWIDEASYEQLLQKWRFAPMGDPFFQGACGMYFNEVIWKRRDEVDAASISKKLGWEK